MLWCRGEPEGPITGGGDPTTTTGHSLGTLLRRLAALFHRRRLEQDLDEEFAFHLAMRQDEERRRGTPSAAAEVVSRRGFGNVLHMKDQARDAWLFSWLDGILQDVRSAARTLRRTPGLSLVVITTLALGIGATTALFSISSAIVSRQLPVPEAERLVAVSLTDRLGNAQRSIHYSTFLELQRSLRAFEASFAYSGGALFTTEVNGAVIAAALEASTPEYYSLLAVRPHLGRVISTDDMPSSGEAAAVVVLGYRFWQRHFAGDPSAVGQRLNVDGTPLTIIGILPDTFRGLQTDAGSDIFVPLSLLRRLGGAGADLKRPIRATHTIGRLRDGATQAQASAELDTLWSSLRNSTAPRGLSQSEQEDLRTQRVKVEAFARGFSSLRTRYADSVTVLLSFTIVLLIIACTNLSGLLLVRFAAREHQLAVRLALGATHMQLVRGVFIESLLLSLAGAIVAIPLASWACKALAATIWTNPEPLLVSVTPDARVLAVTATIAIAAGLLVGVLPAVVSSRIATAYHCPSQSDSHEHHQPLGEGALGRPGFFLARLVAECRATCQDSRQPACN